VAQYGADLEGAVDGGVDKELALCEGEEGKGEDGVVMLVRLFL
jgi:hypothetical protein